MKQREKVLSLTKKDFIVQTFKSGGKGGQYQNKTESGVRIIHPASGAVGEARDERSQAQNKTAAFERLCATDKFKLWIKIETAKACDKLNKPNVTQFTKEEIKQIVARELAQDIEDGKVIFETKDVDGNWIKETK